MTREEAIDILKHPNEEYHGSDGTSGYTFNPNRKNYEAFQLAIKALEQEPCGDCISRQAVLAIAGDSCLNLDSYDDTKEFCDEIKALTPVTPQEPILDKIEDEIQKLRGCSCWCSDGIIDDVEDIIDKYRPESEET